MARGMESASAKHNCCGNGSSGVAAVSGTLKISAISINTTIDENYGTLLVDTTSGDITITLPDCTLFEEYYFNIKKVDTSSNKVIVTSLSLIEGSSSDFYINGYNQSYTFHAHNTGWRII